MFRLRNSFCLIIALCAFSSNALAQNVDEIRQKLEQARAANQEVRIEIKGDGNTYIGSIQSLSSTEVTITTSSGTLSFSLDRIDEVTIIDPNNKATRWHKNTSRNRLFLSQTALNNGANTGYYQNIYIFLSNISYSPTNFLTVNAGFSNLPQLTLDGDFFLLGAKLNVPIEGNMNLGISGTLYSIDNEEVGFVNFLGTYSGDRLDLTAGLGYGISRADNSSGVFIFGAQYRVSERVSLITENFSLPGVDDTLISIGPRFLGKKIATDLGFFFLPGEASEALPYVSFTVGF